MPMLIDAGSLAAYHARHAVPRHLVKHGYTMPDDEHQESVDPLTIGDLITLQEAAEYAGLAYKSLLAYARSGRLKAKRLGYMWVTTRAAVDEYLRSRDVNSIPKKYRPPS